MAGGQEAAVLVDQIGQLAQPVGDAGRQRAGADQDAQGNVVEQLVAKSDLRRRVGAGADLAVDGDEGLRLPAAVIVEQAIAPRRRLGLATMPACKACRSSRGRLLKRARA